MGRRRPTHPGQEHLRSQGFFEWATLSGRLHGDPARPIRPPKKRGVERTTFSRDQERAIFASNDRRDRLALHLLLKVGIRKGALQGVQFLHFDDAQKRLTIFTKGGKVQTVPIVSPASGMTSSVTSLTGRRSRTSTSSAASTRFHGGTQRSGSGRSCRRTGSTASSTATSRWASTDCTTGGTGALSGRGRCD